ncbi:GNAT family N-acetyltransferase [Nocardia sp. NPDC003979]
MTGRQTTRTSTAATPSPSRVAVREIDSESELHQFRRWAAMCGFGDPDLLVEQLLGFHRDGLLGSDRATVHDTLDTHGVPAAAATRTTALVAVADGSIVGGILTGPTMWSLTRAIVSNPDHLLLALLRIAEIQVLAVEENHRRLGVGTALVHAATAAARTMKAHMVYGEFPNTPTLTSFYRAAGLTVHHPDTAIEFSELAGIDLTLTPDPEDRVFTHGLR